MSCNEVFCRPWHRSVFSELYLDGESESTPICIDMRKSGSVARYARRSCHPNVKLQHFFIGGKIHFVAVATEKVERGDEVCFQLFFFNFDGLRCMEGDCDEAVAKFQVEGRGGGEEAEEVLKFLRKR